MLQETEQISLSNEMHSCSTVINICLQLVLNYTDILE